jgi:hypothetical protein
LNEISARDVAGMILLLTVHAINHTCNSGNIRREARST